MIIERTRAGDLRPGAIRRNVTVFAQELSGATWPWNGSTINCVSATPYNISNTCSTGGGEWAWGILSTMALRKEDAVGEQGSGVCVGGVYSVCAWPDVGGGRCLFDWQIGRGRRCCFHRDYHPLLLNTFQVNNPLSCCLQFLPLELTRHLPLLPYIVARVTRRRVVRERLVR